MTRHARRLLNLLLATCIAFGLMACGLAYWSVLRAPDLNGREDNPRLFEREVRIQRGPILAADGTVLAENSGTDARQDRRYPFPQGGHAVGYASLIYGTSGSEEGLDATLRGDTLSEWNAFVRDLLHLPQVGQAVELALDPALQATAVDALADRSGAAIVLELPADCAADEPCPALLRAVASAPGYDANVLSARPGVNDQLDATFNALLNDQRAPLFNRATQGQYQPGLTLQPLLIAAALDQGLIRLDDLVPNANRPVPINGILTHCTTAPPEPTTWANVLQHQCPAPMLELGERWGVAELTAVVDSYGLTSDPPLRIDTTTTLDDPLENAQLAAIGHDNLSITPLRLALALGALADGGRQRPGQLTTAVQDTSYAWQPLPPLGTETRPLSPEAAVMTDDLLTPTAIDVLSGPDGSTNSWAFEQVEGANGRVVIVTVLENTTSRSEVARLSQTIRSALPR